MNKSRVTTVVSLSVERRNGGDSIDAIGYITCFELCRCPVPFVAKRIKHLPPCSCRPKRPCRYAKLDADSCVAAATRCLESIVRRFGGFVRDTLAAPVAAGRVDLAREDRVARCREAHRVRKGRGKDK